MFVSEKMLTIMCYYNNIKIMLMFIYFFFSTFFVLLSLICCGVTIFHFIQLSRKQIKILPGE